MFSAGGRMPPMCPHVPECPKTDHRNASWSSEMSLSI
uniref:Uncharacterized protein n=1 Tax=Anguilla anguilla TaxID=7936 RepID=A0A0E9U6P9_ANGAN